MAVTIIFRVIVGVVCDILGARRGLAFLLLLACPGIVGMMSAAKQEWMGPKAKVHLQQRLLRSRGGRGWNTSNNGIWQAAW